MIYIFSIAEKVPNRRGLPLAGIWPLLDLKRRANQNWEFSSEIAISVISLRSKFGWWLLAVNGPKQCALAAC